MITTVFPHTSGVDGQFDRDITGTCGSGSPGTSSRFCRPCSVGSALSGTIRPIVMTIAMMFVTTSAMTTSVCEASPQISDDAIREAGERIMQHTDFRSVRRLVLERRPAEDVDLGFLQNALNWLGDTINSGLQSVGDFLQWIFSGLNTESQRPVPPPASAPEIPWQSSPPWNLTQLITALAAATLLLLVILFVAMIVRRGDRKRKKDPGLPGSDDITAGLEAPPGELAASTYESRAVLFASQGNHRAAIRELLLGSMSWIERAGLIRFRKGLTNRDYLRSVRRRPAQRDAWLTTARQFELVFFGRRRPTVEMFESCLTDFQRAFREEETPTASI